MMMTMSKADGEMMMMMMITDTSKTPRSSRHIVNNGILLRYSLTVHRNLELLM